jgi:hypothetical protein
MLFVEANHGRNISRSSAWQNAMELALKIYHATTKFPRDEIYGLTSQLRRAAVSVPSNIAEGKGRSSDKELLQFLSRARGLRLRTSNTAGSCKNLPATCRVWTASPWVNKQMMSVEC